jgi:hypothetical protein
MSFVSLTVCDSCGRQEQAPRWIALEFRNDDPLDYRAERLDFCGWGCLTTWVALQADQAARIRAG